MSSQIHTVRRRMVGGLAVVLAAAAALAGCSSAPAPSASPGTGTSPTGAPPAASRTLTVLAAASLTDVFTTIGHDFEQANPGVTVTLSFDGSSTLVKQIQEGAPADVFASADQANMDKLTSGGLTASQPTTFATNSIVVAVPADNPGKITGLADLAKPGIKTVLCDKEVPCGAAAQRVLDAAKVSVTPVSLEQNVTAVATKLTTGEADAGMIYTTDVTATQGKVTAIALPDDPAVAQAALTTYPIAVVKGTADAELAAQFIAFVTSSQGQQVLSDAGFMPPS